MPTVDVCSGQHHSDVVIVHDVTLSGDGKIGGDIACCSGKRAVSCGNAPDDRPPLKSRKGTWSQVPRSHSLKGHLTIPTIINAAGLVERLATEHHLRCKRHGLSMWTSPACLGCERMGTAFDRCRSAAQFHSEDHISHRPPSVCLTNVVVPLFLARIRGNYMLDAQATVP